MNRREFLGRLANYYTVAAVTGEPFGLYLPFTRVCNFTNNRVWYNNSYYFSLSGGYYAIVGIYDEKDRIVYANGCVRYNPYSSYTYVTIGDKTVIYSTSFAYSQLNISRPGIYTSKVIFSGYKSRPLVPEIQFEVRPVMQKSNYGYISGAGISLDHKFIDDKTNEQGILYRDIPTELQYYKYHS